MKLSLHVIHASFRIYACTTHHCYSRHCKFGMDSLAEKCDDSVENRISIVF